MLEYDRIDISEGIDINKNKQKECMLCHYWYFLGKNFNIAIVHVKKSAYRICFLYMSKQKAKSLMNNSNLIDKMGVL